jgi:hypothetical protein
MKHRSRWLIAAIVVVFAAAGAVALTARWWAADLERTAYAGKAQVEAGARSMASQDATAAASHFRSASRSFERAQSMLSPAWLEVAADAVPWARRQYVAATTLVAIGLDGSAAGGEMAAALRETTASPAPAGSSRLSSLLSAGRKHVDNALARLIAAADLASRLRDDGLDPRLLKAVRSVKDALRPVAPFLGRSQALLSLERYLLSSERRILVVSQDSAELRPTGGFAGSYGILDVGPQGFTLEKYADVYSLPHQPGHVPPPRGAGMTGDFGFRDANWWIDFPTSARAMLGFWRADGQKPVDAIIAIDVVTVKDLLDVFGPMTVPSYSETFTSQNLLDRLLYLVEVKSAEGPNKKGVLVALAGRLEQRMLSAGPGDLSRAALATARSADSKHVQMYFVDQTAQSAVTALGWSGALAPPAGATDVLAVSNAMTLPGKINIAMRKTIAYRVALLPDGSADTTLVLTYSNTAPFGLPPSQQPVFGDYLRVYRTPGTLPAPGSARLSNGAAFSMENGWRIAIRTFHVLRGQTQRERIATRVPGAWGPERAAVATGSPGAAPVPGSVQSAANGTYRYRLFIVRQADLQDIPTAVTVTPPPGWRVSSAGARSAASGQVLAATHDGKGASLSLPLSGDVILDVILRPR